MNTLKGVIAATRRRGEVVPVESDLFIEPWYFILSSGLYPIGFEDGVAPRLTQTNAPEIAPGGNQGEGGGGDGEGGGGDGEGGGGDLLPTPIATELTAVCDFHAYLLGVKEIRINNPRPFTRMSEDSPEDVCPLLQDEATWDSLFELTGYYTAEGWGDGSSVILDTDLQLTDFKLSIESRIGQGSDGASARFGVFVYPLVGQGFLAERSVLLTAKNGPNDTTIFELSDYRDYGFPCEVSFEEFDEYNPFYLLAQIGGDNSVHFEDVLVPFTRTLTAKVNIYDTSDPLYKRLVAPNCFPGG